MYYCVIILTAPSSESIQVTEDDVHEFPQPVTGGARRYSQGMWLF